MHHSIPEILINAILAELEEQFGKGAFVNFQFASGGCINNAGFLECTHGTFFVKWNSKERFQNMFGLEAKGLHALKEASSIVTIPQVLATGDDGQHVFIVMEAINAGVRKQNYWEILGQGLASIHSYSAENFGLAYDNYIGSLPQRNEPKNDWTYFFITHRLQHPFELAFDKGEFDNTDRKRFDEFINVLPAIIKSDEKPALIHGDLWSGNLMVDVEGGPCILDPAVYYANREIEIAFTQLFGRFGAAFYDSYNEAFPMNPGFDERCDIWNLYPLLVHVNLFGTSYRTSVIEIVRKFL